MVRAKFLQAAGQHKNLQNIASIDYFPIIVTNQEVHLRSLFRDAVDFLGLTVEDQARLLNGKSPDDDRAFSYENLGDVVEPMAHISVAFSLLVDTFEEARAIARDTALPGLQGQSIADCILSRDQKKIARALHAMEVHLDVA